MCGKGFNGCLQGNRISMGLAPQLDFNPAIRTADYQPSNPSIIFRIRSTCVAAQ
jgi:hypothetical protein